MKPKFEVFRDKDGLFRWQVLDENGRRVDFQRGKIVGVRPDRRAREDVQTMLGMIANSGKSSAA